MPKKKRKKRNFSFKTPKGAKYEVLFRKPDKRYFDDADGICTSPKEERPKIHINPSLTDQSTLNTAVHEIAHAFFWNKTELEVTKFANTISRFLFNYCGWRKHENECAEPAKSKRNIKRSRK